MRQLIASISVVFLAGLIFYGGAGVNLVSYCCNDCRLEGVQVVVDEKCCEVHGHTHDMLTIETPNGTVSHAHEMCCNLERIAFDWDASGKVEFDLQPVVLDLLSLGTPGDFSMPVPFANKETFVMPTGPPLVLCPRVYLSLLTTLLI